MKRLWAFLVLLVALAFSAYAQDAQLPRLVNVPGTFQPLFGCSGPWQPDCELTALVYDETTGIWSRTFTIPAGDYEYKVALNGSWTENYGGFADRDGPNIRLSLSAETDVTFYYSDKTKWIADDVRHKIVTAFGDFQTLLGCAANDDPACMAMWLQDPDGDGVYSGTTNALPMGNYSARFAVNFDPASAGEPVAFNVPSAELAVTFTYDRSLNLMVVNAGGSAITGANLRDLRAYWVNADTFLWDVEVNEAAEYAVLYSPDAAMSVTLFGLAGEYERAALTPSRAPLDAATAAKFPHLAHLPSFTLDPTADRDAILRGQFAIAQFGADGSLQDINGVQIAGALDALYATDAPLGVHFDAAGVPTLSVWAPTAQTVSLLLFDDSNPRTRPVEYPMTRDDRNGVWSITGADDWRGKFYLYRVKVFAPSVQEIVVNDVTDPYSVSLAINSTRSQIVDLNDPATMPEGWQTLQKPPLENFTDITIYELHIRDFSAYDQSVPPELRGTYLAFTTESDGVKHLRQLAQAGLTHLHLLPSFDIATINENRARWFEPNPAELASFPPDSEEQQAQIERLRDLDGFNWGYDPYHFQAPEGSYATAPDGVSRLVEYRQMVMAINQMGLRVVQDVVFNHTNASGQAPRSVLDKVVPTYYHRLNNRGVVERSTCCDNTATEHDMMRRLMVDTVLLQAVHYKIDGFRFDLMGHHMLADMQAVRAALDALTLEKDGVDGKKIYIYGEGWNFGEVANNARGVNATQLNIGGTGIGVFNDRLRDAVRGGNPFGDREKQGLANGIYSNSNGLHPLNDSRERALLFADQVRVGLAGNLRGYTFSDRTGATVTGAQVDYNGSPVGYTLLPQENIVYVDKHDNETLYDNNIYKAPVGTSMTTRVRMQTLANAFVMYAQGVPFFQAGSDLLRSKSLDRNSYNSGDWFNRLDWTYNTNNFGVGLPPRGDNAGEWERMRPFLADPANVPTREDILLARDLFNEMLRVRYSSPLFRLTTAEDVQARVVFHNTGPDQIAGVIVMELLDTVGEDLDPNYAAIVVIFNGYVAPIRYTAETLPERNYVLHPVLQASSDAELREAHYIEGANTFDVPAYSATVFVVPQN